MHHNPLNTLNRAATRNGVRRELNVLSDEQLRDIGITRGQIDDVAADLALRNNRPRGRKLKTRAMSLAALFFAYRSF